MRLFWRREVKPSYMVNPRLAELEMALEILAEISLLDRLLFKSLYS